MKKIKYVLAAMALTMIMFFAATDPQSAAAQEDNSAGGQNYYGQGGGQSVERLASRMERFMKMHVEVVRNQMQLNSLLGGLIELEIKNAQNGRFTHISDSTYFDTRTAEIFKRPKP
jgi:succinate dehydrogenase/fumarate reductase flavoprotein subunit